MVETIETVTIRFPRGGTKASLEAMLWNIQHRATCAGRLVVEINGTKVAWWDELLDEAEERARDREQREKALQAYEDAIIAEIRRNPTGCDADIAAAVRRSHTSPTPSREVQGSWIPARRARMERTSSRRPCPVHGKDCPG